MPTIVAIVVKSYRMIALYLIGSYLWTIKDCDLELHDPWWLFLFLLLKIIRVVAALFSLFNRYTVFSRNFGGKKDGSGKTMKDQPILICWHYVYYCICTPYIQYTVRCLNERCQTVGFFSINVANILLFKITTNYVNRNLVVQKCN